MGGNNMTLSRRHVLRGSAAVAAGVAMPNIARAQAWNPNNIRIVVPFAAGGSVDAMGRIIADGLKQGRSGAFVVENRTGASGTVGASAVAKSAPDGETWLVTFDIHAVLPSLIASLPYDHEKDLVPVTLIGTSPMVFVTAAKSPFENFEQMVAHGKAKGRLNYGSGSAGTLGHLAMTVIAEQAKVPMTHVNYRGGTPALNDAIAGHIDGFIGSSAIVAQHLESGTARAILQTSGTRQPHLPNVPTAKELGFPDIAADAWWAVFAPGGTPRHVIDGFHAELQKIFSQPANQKALAGYQIKLALSKPDDFQAFYRREMQTWGKIVRDHKITVGG
jgi:tripartite-type tricarboxylate transporter receptor subunit TctC